MMEKKVLFILNYFVGGGTERVTLTLAENFHKKGVEVHIIVTGPFNKDYTLPRYIKSYFVTSNKLSFLNSIPVIRFAYKLYQALKLFIKIKYIYKKNGKFNLILRCIRAPMPKFIFKNFIKRNNIFTWIHIDDSFSRKNSYKKKLFLNTLVTKKIILVSNGLKLTLKEFGAKNKETHTIYNPFNIEKIKKLAREKNAHTPKEAYIIHAGRFGSQKRHDRLLKSFKKLKTPCKLVLLTHHNDELEQLIKENGLENKVIIAGFQKNPYPWFKCAKLSVLCSDYEALPMVIIESLICGCPVVSTDCRSGPNEILTGDLAKWLVPMNKDENKLTDNLAAKIDEALNTKIKINPDIFEKFNADKITDEYLQLIRD